jgi:tetratricopeptide (TPR) repeat protein
LVALVSITFIAGAFGPAVVQLLGRELLRRIEEMARRAAEHQTRVASSELRQDNQATKQEARATQEELKVAKQTLAPKLYVQLAVSATQDDRYEEALENVEAALREDPNFSRAYIEKGRALKRLGRTSEALEAVEKAISIDPTNPAALYNRACYKVMLGRVGPDVFEDLRAAFELRSKLRDTARKDTDLASILSTAEMKELLGVPQAIEG